MLPSWLIISTVANHILRKTFQVICAMISSRSVGYFRPSSVENSLSFLDVNSHFGTFYVINFNTNVIAEMFSTEYFAAMRLQFGVTQKSPQLRITRNAYR